MLDFLNTPVEKCDPVLVRIVLSAIARQAAANAPAELGVDAQQLFAKMWGRIAPALDQAQHEAAPAAPPATPDTVQPETAQCIETPVIQAEPADDAATGAVAVVEHTPAAALPVRPITLHRRKRFERRRPARRHERRSAACYPGSRKLRVMYGSPPVRRLCYAACAGPP